MFECSSFGRDRVWGDVLSKGDPSYYDLFEHCGAGGLRRGIWQLPFEGGGSFWPGQNGEAPTGADPTILISSVGCKMGCNCGRRPAAQGPGPGPSVRRLAPPPAPARVPAPAPAPAPRSRPVAVAATATATAAVVASGRSIDTSLWGPSLWIVLHTAAQYTTTANKRQAWIRLLTAMKGALPCPECSAHYNAWITANPVSLPPSGTELQVAISSWILALHNDVNRRNDVGPWTLEQVAANYTNNSAAINAYIKLKPYMPVSFLDIFEYLL